MPVKMNSDFFLDDKESRFCDIESRAPEDKFFVTSF